MLGSIEFRYSVDQLQSELCMERATWQLFHVLAHDRRDDEEKEEPPRLDNCRASDKQLAELLFLQDSSVRQAQASVCVVCVCVTDVADGVAGGGLARGSGQSWTGALPSKGCLLCRQQLLGKHSP